MATLVSSSRYVLTHGLKNESATAQMDSHEECDHVNAWCWSHNGQVIATWADDSKVWLNHAKTGKRIIELTNGRYPILWCQFSSTSEYLVSGSEGGQVQVWNIQKRTLSYEIWEDDSEHITGVCWKNNDRIIVAVTNKGVLYIIDWESKKLVDKLQYDSYAIRCLKFSYFKSNLVATGGDNGIVTVWDIKKNELYHAFETSSHSDTCTGVIFSPTNELLLCSGGLDGKIQFFDIIEKRNVKTIEANETVTALAFFQDGINIAAGTPSGSIYIYNLKDSNVKIILKGHEGFPITCLEFKRPDHYKSRPKSKKKTEEQKIKSYDDIRAETRNKIQSERKNKGRVEITKIPAKTSNRSTVKATKTIKSILIDDANPKNAIIEEPMEESFHSPTVGPLFTAKQKKYLENKVNEKLLDHEVEFSEYFSNLQLEMVRQFMIQKDELVSFVQAQIKSDLDKYL